MKILSLISNINNFKNSNCTTPNTRYITSPLAPLAEDTVSFGVMKKSQFDGIDFAVVEKFKAPIEKFNSNEDLQDWAEIQTEEIVNNDFGGRQQETRVQRKAMLKEWSDYVLYENDAYNNATALLILNAITKDLRPDNDKLPPVLNKGVLADCISEIDKNSKADHKYQFDLNKMYDSKLKAFYLDDLGTGETETKWIVIPSASHDPKHFTQNVEKLKTLSHKNWCTKSFNAEPYLSDGDFHIYLENGQPKLGLRFIGDKIQEIQGELNNSKIPVSYLGTVEEHIEENNLELTLDADYEIAEAEKAKMSIEKIKLELSDAIANNEAKKIFEYFDFNVEEDENGFLTIEEYRQPSKSFTFKDCGIDENMLFQKVKQITLQANFSNSQLTSLGELKSIGLFATFTNSQITDLGKLETIGADARFDSSHVKNLGKLKSIGGNVDFYNSKVTNLGNLEVILGDAYFENSQVTDLGKLEKIGGHMYLENSQLTNLCNLEEVCGDVSFSKSKLTDLGNLKSIGGNVSFYNSQVTSLGKLESIGANANFSNSQVKSLGKLKAIGCNAVFADSQLDDLGELESIGSSAYFKNSKIKNLGNLKSIGEDAYFEDSRVINLGKLEVISEDAYFENSQVTDLGNLKRIGWNAYIYNSKLSTKDFDNIKIGGHIREIPLPRNDYDFNSM